MVKKAWFFGDSFTAGWGAREGEPYYITHGPGKTFSNLLSEFYGAEERNYGLAGKCNNAIIKRITDFLPEIKSGDIVILSNTSPLRDLVPTHTKSDLTSQKLFSSNIHPESIGYIDNEIDELLIQYCFKVKEPYIPAWNHHYRSIFINFVNYFQSINCTCIFWDYSAWSEEEEEGMKFENIYQATSSKILDMHWSYRGHKDAFEWIKKGIKDQKKFLF